MSQRARSFVRHRVHIVLLAGLAAAAVLAHPVLWWGGRSTAADPEVLVIDGDTLQIGGEVVDLYGIDAPELGQRCLHDAVLSHCGLSAAFELGKILRLSSFGLECAPAEAAGRGLGRVCLQGDENIAEVLIKDGYALALDEGAVNYMQMQHSAREANLGLWHSRYVLPAEWRAGKRLPEEDAAPVPCPIKGVVRQDGRRLYYVPNDEAYETLDLDPAAGDRLFCSDEEARAAGWRRQGEAD